jgi:hypothetical protein
MFVIIRCRIFVLQSDDQIKKKEIRTNRNIIFLNFYGCENWSLTLRKERWLKGFENWMLKRIFGPTRDEVKEEWRKLHN